MKKYYVHDGNVCHSNGGMEDDCCVMYDASDVDARIAQITENCTQINNGQQQRIAELEHEVRELILANRALKAELEYYADEG